MKPLMALIAVALFLVALGLWLVWPQKAAFESRAVSVEEEILEEPQPPPVTAPASEVKPRSSEPEQVLDQREVLRVLEEVAKNEQALEDWDQRLALACKNLVKGKKYEAAQQCYQLRLARNPEDGQVYLERGILHARMAKRVESYWDYVKFLELEPDHSQAPQVRRIVGQYEEWASGVKNPKREETDYRQEIADLAKVLYEEAYVLKASNPEAALKKLDQIRRLLEHLPEEYQTYMGKAERLTKRIESGL